jgi:hypothetical protein
VTCTCHWYKPECMPRICKYTEAASQRPASQKPSYTCLPRALPQWCNSNTVCYTCPKALTWGIMQNGICEGLYDIQPCPWQRPSLPRDTQLACGMCPTCRLLSYPLYALYTCPVYAIYKQHMWCWEEDKHSLFTLIPKTQDRGAYCSLHKHLTSTARTHML